MSMTFLDLQNELATVPGARFKSTQSASYKHWINTRAAELWNLEDWTFTQNSKALTVTAGTDTITVPDLGTSRGLWNQYGNEVYYVPRREFNSRHRANVYNGTTGDPTSYTIVNGAIYLDPTPSTTSSAWWLDYGRVYGHKDNSGTFVVGDMTLDTDRPAMPDEAHYLLVHGATAMGSINMNDFTYQFAEQGWQNGLEVLRNAYLSEQRTSPQQWGATRVW